MKDFTREEIFVIKACKGHFGKDGYEDARIIIQKLIYGNNKRYFTCELAVVRSILLKSRDWEMWDWEDRTQRLILKARESNLLITGKLFVDSIDAFEENLINLHLSEIASLRVRHSVKPEVGDNNPTYVDVLNHDITKEESEKVRNALDKG